MSDEFYYKRVQLPQSSSKQALGRHLSIKWNKWDFPPFPSRTSHLLLPLWHLSGELRKVLLEFSCSLSATPFLPLPCIHPQARWLSRRQWKLNCRHSSNLGVSGLSTKWRCWHTRDLVLREVLTHPKCLCWLCYVARTAVTSPATGNFPWKEPGGRKGGGGFTSNKRKFNFSASPKETNKRTKWNKFNQLCHSKRCALAHLCLFKHWIALIHLLHLTSHFTIWL